MNIDVSSLKINLPDKFYEDLLNQYKNLSDSQIEFFNIHLIFLMANHIGKNEVLNQLFHSAHQTLQTIKEN